MRVLAIETSCDETALSIIEANGEKENPEFNILGNVLISQTKIHEQYGGVFPMVAKREHGKNLVPLLLKVLEEAAQNDSGVRIHGSRKEPETSNLQLVTSLLEREQELLPLFIDKILSMTNPGIDCIAVTEGPGLEPALWVGISFAKALGVLWKIPVVPVNHMEGHIMAALLPKLQVKSEKFTVAEMQFPALALLISGGHTELVLIKTWREYEIIGKTRDDAVGEAFDKVARILGLPYPGGPEISSLAQKARQAKQGSTLSPSLRSNLVLPRPMIHSDDFDFSFSGLKTAVLYLVKKLGTINKETTMDIAREFEDAVTETLVAKTTKAIEHYGIDSLIVSGGVIANRNIRQSFEKISKEYSIPLFIPTIELSTDNALMIALAGYFSFTTGSHGNELRAQGNATLA